MINNFSAEERETIINLSDADDTWDVYTMQKKVMTKLAKAGIKPYETVLDDNGDITSASYKVPYSQLSFRKVMELSQEQKEQKRLVLEKARQNKK